MTLLDRVAGGNILEPKEEPTPQFRGTKEDSDAIRERIKADLLPYQKAVVEDTDHRIIGFVAGYGAGKSRTMWIYILVMMYEHVLQRKKNTRP